MKHKKGWIAIIAVIVILAFNEIRNNERPALTN